MRSDSGYAYLPAGQAEVEFGKYEARIKALERLNSTLAAEVDRMRPVVETAIKWNKTNYRNTEEIAFALDALGEACDGYEAIIPDTETTNAQ